MRRFTLAFLSFFLVMSTAAQAQTDEQNAVKNGAARMTGKTIETLYLGHTVNGETKKGYKYKTPIGADGTIKANHKRGPGKFLVIEDKACMQFEGLWDGKPMCWAVYKVGDGKYQTFRGNGSLSANVTFD